jgi:hypothetical protein
MKVVESIYLNMAMANLDVAVDRLQQLLTTDKYPADERGLPWAGLGCNYSRCIHKNAWRDGVSKDRVKSEIIPLLKRASREVARLLEVHGITDEDKAEIRRYAENIQLRAGNLEQSYLNDLITRFPADTMEPRFAPPE